MKTLLIVLMIINNAGPREQTYEFEHMGACIEAMESMIMRVPDGAEVRNAMVAFCAEVDA